jgi:hypothetical protein
MADRGHALLERVELGRIVLVVLGIDHQERRLDPAEVGSRIEIARGAPLVQSIVGVRRRGLGQPLVDEGVGRLAVMADRRQPPLAVAVSIEYQTFAIARLGGCSL